MTIAVHCLSSHRVDVQQDKITQKPKVIESLAPIRRRVDLILSPDQPKATIATVTKAVQLQKLDAMLEEICHSSLFSTGLI